MTDVAQRPQAPLRTGSGNIGSPKLPKTPTKDAKSAASTPSKSLGSVGRTAKSTAGGAAGKAKSTAGDAASKAKQAAPEPAQQAGDEVQGKAEEGLEGAEGVGEEAQSKVDEVGNEATEASTGDDFEDVGEDLESKAEGAVDDAQGTAEDAGEQAEGTVEGTVEGQEGEEGEEEGDEGSGEEAIPAGEVDEHGQVIDSEGNVIGRISEGSAPAHSIVDQEGDILDSEGNVIGRAEPLEEDAEGVTDAAQGGVEDAAEDAQDAAEEVERLNPEDIVGPLKVNEEGEVLDQGGEVIGTLAEGDAKDLATRSIKDIDSEGNLVGENGSILGKVDMKAIEKPDPSVLKGLKVNKQGNVATEDGTPVGRIIEGSVKKLVGKSCDELGQIWSEHGKIIGRAEVIPETEKEGPTASFEDFPDATVEKNGDIVYEGRVVGKVVEGDPKKLVNKTVDVDGDILDKHGNVVGKAERYDEPEPEAPEEPEKPDLSELAGLKVNKAGLIISDKGVPIGRLVEGDARLLAGKDVDEDGQIWSSKGKVIGRAELIPEDEREEGKSGPFEDYPDAVVEKNGNITYQGEVIGKVVEGDPKKLAGRHPDADGDILDKYGSVEGKAERWYEPEVEEEKIDNSALAGKRVNKMGYVVDEHGSIFGRVIEGDPKRLLNKMCDKDGAIWNEGGQIIGRAELVPDAEREQQKDGPFADFTDCKVQKDGMIRDAAGTVVGRLVEGDPKKLAGRVIDVDGDITDKNGNAIGKAERYDEPEEEKEVNPMAGRKVNKKGEVVDEDGDVIGRLTDGNLQACVGKKIDDDNDVVDSKGRTVGHVSLLEDIPEPEEEPKESEEEIAKKKQEEQDKEIAKRISLVISQTLEKIKPVMKMITEHIEKADRTPKEELDEEKLVQDVKPLIEQGSSILQEANGAIRALDPDGRIQANAKHKTASREATPEEYQLADKIKDLTENVTTTIENAKKKIADMPHAKKKLNPLWGLLQEPLFQIIAAVGLLLSGVLGLVGKLLNGLGLGGLVNNLLGGLGLSNVLDNLGLSDALGLAGGKKKK